MLSPPKLSFVFFVLFRHEVKTYFIETPPLLLRSHLVVI